MTIANIVLMTFFTFSYLPYPNCHRLYTSWLAAVRKPQPVPWLMLSWFWLGLFLGYRDTFQCIWAHGSLRTQAISYSPGTPIGASITCRVIFDLSQNTVADNFRTKTKQTTSLQRKGTKRGWTGTGVGVGRNDKMRRETAPVGLQEGAGGLSFTVLCFPKGMHSWSRVRDNYTAARLYEKTICRDENLLLWVLNN